MNGLSLQNIDQFEKALMKYQEATGKDMVDVLNRAGRNVGYRAAQFTGIAAAAKIRQELYGNQKMLFALTRLSLRGRGITGVSKEEFAIEVENFVSRRANSTRYLRSGWAQAIIDFGGTFRGSRLERGTHGYGHRATVVELLAELAWIIDEPNDRKAESAVEVGFKPLQEALDFVTADMLKHAEETMSKRAEEFSA